jgi:hypothetical protein
MHPEAASVGNGNGDHDENGGNGGGGHSQKIHRVMQIHERDPRRDD